MFELKDWDDLPLYMKTPEVKPYYDYLHKKKSSLIFKRVFDVLMSASLLVVLSPVMIVISCLIFIDSPGKIFYRQERVTSYGRKFYIHKFRTMIENADKIGPQVSVDSDNRITKVGKILRKYRLDEFPQLIDVLKGDMSFVGTRPEVPKYVKEYTPEMLATLLMPAGITSKASIKYKDEAELLESAENVDDVYINKVLPSKMKYNLESIKNFNCCSDIFTMVETVIAVIR